MGIKDIQAEQRENRFKSVNLERKTQKAYDIETFIENAEGETSSPPKRKGVGGAPLKPKEKKRTERCTLYCTPAELHKIREMAEEDGMTLNEFLRYKVFDRYKNS